MVLCIAMDGVGKELAECYLYYENQSVEDVKHFEIAFSLEDFCICSTKAFWLGSLHFLFEFFTVVL